MNTDTATMYVRDNNNFLTSAIGNEIVVMNMTNGNFVGLNTVAADIWTILENPVSKTILVEKLTRMYDVTPEECLQDTTDCMEQLLTQKMILEHV